MKFSGFQIPLLVAVAGFVGTGIYWLGDSREDVETERTEVVIDKEKYQPLFDHTLSLEERLDLVKRLGESVPWSLVESWIEEIDANVLETRKDSQSFVVFNEIVSAKRERSTQHRETRQFLIKILKQDRFHSVLRDYSAQHLALLIGKGQQGTQADREIIETLCTALEASDLRNTTIPGTIAHALYGFKDKGVKLEAADLNRLGHSVTTFLQDPATSLSLRISLVHSSAKSSPELALPTLRSLLDSTDLADALAMAVCAALGEIGDRSDVERLSQFQSRRTFASAAAATALTKLTQRLALSQS